ncbi:MAG TPA: hypothetical protein VN577_12380 [Terriglobales bacterium]|nr:hypothetical protein [Terriglobales bacterium]
MSHREILLNKCRNELQKTVFLRCLLKLRSVRSLELTREAESLKRQNRQLLRRTRKLLKTT